MNKIVSKLKDAMPLIMLIMAQMVIFTPLPIMVIQVMIAVNICFSLFLFITRFFPDTKAAYYFPRLAVYNSLCTCGIAISTTRTFLTIKSLEGHIPAVVKIGQWICRENYVSGFFTTLILSGTLLYFCKIYIKRVLERSARISLEQMSSKLISIDEQLARNIITKEKAETEKNKIRKRTDNFDNLDHAAKFLFGTISAFIGLFLVAVIGGTTVGILDQNMNWRDALNQYIMLSSGYLVIFFIPLFLTALGFKISRTDLSVDET